LLRTSTQSEPHFVSPPVHVNPQLPDVHDGTPPLGAVHAVPHPPQFEVSFAVVTQDPLQFVWLPGHPDDEHLPPEQTSLLAQAFGQVPQ
jgi:hypothetical protein